MDALKKRERYMNRLAVLKNERNGWVAHWKDIADHIKPRRSRIFKESGASRGAKKHGQIINGTAGEAVNVLGAGMMAGVTSPARPWFRLTVPDQDLLAMGSVKQWLHVVEERLRDAMAKSNLYSALQQLYEDLALFGPGVLFIEDDEVADIRAYSVPVGEYCLALSDRGQVDTLYRETSLTVGQLVKKFGEDACSMRVRRMFVESKLDESIDVLHVIEPRLERDPKKPGPKDMPYASCWMEVSGDATTGFLRESGFEELPFMAPRWEVSGNEVYGSSPAMAALGDVKALQDYERVSAELAEKIATPPLTGPGTTRNMPVSLLPGALNFHDGQPGSQKLEPLVSVPPAAITVIDAKIEKHERRIKSTFKADLWLALSQSEGPQMTAEEVRERVNEKMLVLGPVMERLEEELLNLIIGRCFGVLYRRGRIPDPPREVQGQPLVAEYLSIMAQAQKAVGTSSLLRLTNVVAQMVSAKPDIVDKLNFDKAVEKLADGFGVSPDVVNTDEDVKKLRDARAQQQQQQAAMQQAALAAKGTKDLAAADTGGQNALTQMVGPMAAAQAGGQ